MRAFIMDLGARALVANHDFIDALHEASGDDLGGLSVPSHAADIDQVATCATRKAKLQEP
jgi:hypothetical protein